MAICRASKYLCVSNITGSMHFPVPRMDSLRQSALQILKIFRMYSVTICHYMHSKLDFSAVEILPRSTGNCGLAVELNWLVQKMMTWMGPELFKVQALMTRAGGSWCFVHDSEQIKVWGGFHGCCPYFFL